MVLIFTISQAVYAASFECPNFHQKVSAAKDSLWIADVPTMEASLQEAHAGLECAEMLDRETVQNDLGDFFLLNAYRAHLSGQDIDREWWLQQSYNLGHWNANFGPEIEALRNELTETNMVSVSVLPVVDVDLMFVVDGRSMDVLEVAEGVHWVEVYHENELLNGQLLHVREGRFVQLPDSVVRTPVAVEESQKIAPWFAGAMFFSSVALSTHTVAMLNHQQYHESSSLSQLEAQRLRTWRWGQTSLLSGALALACASRWMIHERQSRASISPDNTARLLE